MFQAKDKYVRITSNKLSLKIVEKLMQPIIYLKDEDGSTIEMKGLTSSEIDLLLLLSHNQNSFGQIRDLYYLNIVKELGCCNETFYRAVNGLEKKGFIRSYSNGNDGYFNITILDNIYHSEADDKKGYLDTSKDIFFTDAFNALNANEKRLVIKLLLSYQADKGLKVDIRTIATKWLGISTISHVYKYLERIKGLITFKIEQGVNGNTLIHLQPFLDIPKASMSERERYLFNILVKLCFKYKIDIVYNMKEFFVAFKQVLAKFNTFIIDLGPSLTFYTIEKVLKETRSIKLQYIEWSLQLLQKNIKKERVLRAF